MKKEQIELAASLGIDVDKRWSEETLAEKIAEASQPVPVRCVIPNVWTTQGRMLKGEQRTVPPAEADFLVDRRQVERV